MNRKTAWIAAATAAVALAGPATSAGADQGDTLNGGCFFDTNENALLTGGANVGVIYDVSVSRHASGLPSNATVTCWIEVNGVEAPDTRISESGTGVQAGSEVISFASTDTDVVSICQQVTFGDRSTWVGPTGTNPSCSAATTA